MTLQFRPAHAGDAAAIQRVMRSVWPAQAASAARVRAVLRDHNHQVVVAVSAGQVVGFADAFMTAGPDGALRWELDLLAVHPDHRRQGAAHQLIERSTAAGQTRGAALARALIAADNRASEGAFARSSYRTDGIAHGLYVAPASPETDAAAPFPAGLRLIAVSTLSYCGVWLEGCWTPDAFRAARALAAQRGCDMAGAVIPAGAADAVRAVEGAGWALVGPYHWWRRPLRV